ncbi:MAG TPA: YIP1 family protein [archaeon]|nr:YIP1 family protein [archaeon]
MAAMIEKIKSVLMTPDKFFASVKKEQGYAEPVKYTALLSLAAFAVTSAVLSLIAGSFNITGIVIGSVFISVLFIILQFVSAVGTHIFVILAGGKNGYSQTFKAGVYASTPVYLLGFVPLVSMVAVLYSLYLNIKGLSVLQNMSMGRAAAVILIPLLVVIILVAALVGVAIFAILSAASKGVPAV